MNLDEQKRRQSQELAMALEGSWQPRLPMISQAGRLELLHRMLAQRNGQPEIECDQPMIVMGQ